MVQVASTPADEIKTRKVELVLQQLDTLPTLPAVVVRLLALTGSADSKIQEVVQLISADQSLTGKLLSLASSAHAGGGGALRSGGGAGGSGGVTSVQQAVVMLGFEAVREQREVDLVAHGALVLRARERGKLVRQHGLAVVQQAANQRALAVIDAARRDETQHAEVFRLVNCGAHC